ncbi:hypothetical protein [Alkalihalobacillus deserti]|uniref:hypothetical protein n=1 Tax=Alkalihalobacillus deserti TaxID=2879466 RepID=UPI001D140DAF|nr:hypothetical protein [Alkalihalobacillus deserti]
MKRLSSQEIFIILSAVFVLLFMYATIILSAPINELTEMTEQADQLNVIEVNKTVNSSFVYLSPSTEDDNE